MAGVAVEVVVVAAVGFVDDHHDVAALGQQRVLAARLAFLQGAAELLQRGEEDPAAVALGERGPQRLAGVDLPWLLGEQLGCKEPVEELAVELSAVGDHHDGGVLQPRGTQEEVGVELHLEGLAGALRVPHDAGLAIALNRLDRAADSLGDGEVLVRLGGALDDPFLPLGKGGEVAHQLAEALEVGHAVQEGFQGGCLVGERQAVVVDVPLGVVVERRERVAVLRHDAVTDQRQDAGAEGHGELAQIGGELGVGRGDGGGLVPAVLQLHDAHG